MVRYGASTQDGGFSFFLLLGFQVSRRLKDTKNENRHGKTVAAISFQKRGPRPSHGLVHLGSPKG